MKIRSNQKIKFSARGTVIPAVAAVLLVLVIFCTALVHRWIDSVEVRRGQATVDAITIYMLPVIVPPEYIPPETDTTVDPVATEEFIERIAEANGFDERFYKPLSEGDYEVVPNTYETQFKAKIYRIAINRNDNLGHSEGIPAARIRKGFIFRDNTRDIDVPAGCMPVGLELSAIRAAPETFPLSINPSSTFFSEDPSGAIQYLAGNGGTPPDPVQVGQFGLPITAIVGTGIIEGVISGIELLVGSIVIFPVTDAGRVVGFARVEIRAAELEVPPPPAIGNGLVTLVLAPTAVSPAAVRGDGYPVDIEVPEIIASGQVLRTRTVN